MPQIVLMDIVFNVNPLGLEGLGATLTSLVRSCSNTDELNLHFLCSGLDAGDKSNIATLLKSENYQGATVFIYFDAKKSFGHLRSLHGDWTPYGRLLIPEIIQSDRALYLDADLVIGVDILRLREFDFDGHLLGAVYGCPVENTLDSPFLIKNLDWTPDTGYFNSGVVLFNLQKWRAENTDSKWKRISGKYSDELISHDQTLLNALCRGRFAHLPNEFNLPWNSHKEKPANAENGILHFVGSPKPWDWGGKYIHKGFNAWNEFNTSIWKKRYGKITVEKLRRTWKIRRSLAKGIKKKVLSG